MFTISPRRKDDMLLSAVQNNLDKDVVIKNASKSILQELCYSLKELKGLSFFKILSKQTTEKICSHIEYENYGIDIISILPKIKSFCFVDKFNQCIHAKIKVFTTVSENPDQINFEILARKYSCFDWLAEFREKYTDFKYLLDQDLGVMDEQTVKKEVALLLLFCTQRSHDCTMCAIDIKKLTLQEKRLLVQNLKHNIRSYDQIGIANEHVVIFFVGCQSLDFISIMSRLYEKILQRYKSKIQTMQYNLKHGFVDGKVPLIFKKINFLPNNK